MASADIALCYSKCDVTTAVIFSVDSFEVIIKTKIPARMLGMS